MIETHYRSVYAIGLAALRDPDAAEELAQETFLRALVHGRTIRNRESLPAWLMAVARNLALDWQRTNRHRSHLITMLPLEPEMQEALADPRLRADVRLAESEEARLVRESVLKLPSQQREIVLLHYMEGLAQNEIARQLEISPSTVSRQLGLALERLKPLVESRLKPSLSAMASAPRARRSAAAVLLAAVALPRELSAAMLASSTESLPVTSRAVSTGITPAPAPARWLAALHDHGKVMGVLTLCLLLVWFVASRDERTMPAVSPQVQSGAASSPAGGAASPLPRPAGRDATLLLAPSQAPDIPTAEDLKKRDERMRAKIARMYGGQLPPDFAAPPPSPPAEATDLFVSHSLSASSGHVTATLVGIPEEPAPFDAKDATMSVTLQTDSKLRP